MVCGRPFRGISYEIYEKIEINGILKWSYFGDYGQGLHKNQPSKQDLHINLPPIINPIEDGKFIFFPQKTTTSGRSFASPWAETMILYPIELWETNNSSSRSLFRLPIDLRHKFATHQGIFQPSGLSANTH